MNPSVGTMWNVGRPPVNVLSSPSTTVRWVYLDSVSGKSQILDTKIINQISSFRGGGGAGGGV